MKHAQLSPDLSIFEARKASASHLGRTMRRAAVQPLGAAWADSPAALHAAVADALGTTIAGCADLHGGMSPGPAAALRLGDGRTVFVKAISAEVRAHNHMLIRQESAILDVLPQVRYRRHADSQPSSRGRGSR